MEGALLMQPFFCIAMKSRSCYAFGIAATPRKTECYQKLGFEGDLGSIQRLTYGA